MLFVPRGAHHSTFCHDNRKLSLPASASAAAPLAATAASFSLADSIDVRFSGESESHDAKALLVTNTYLLLCSAFIVRCYNSDSYDADSFALEVRCLGGPNEESGSVFPITSVVTSTVR
jgi:hypothetical protein